MLATRPRHIHSWQCCPKVQRPGLTIEQALEADLSDDDDNEEDDLAHPKKGTRVTDAHL